MSAINYYASASDQASGLISERDEYTFDDHGRRDTFTRYFASTPTALASGLSASTNGAFTETRFEQMVYDDRGRIEAELAGEGVLRYSYDEQGRMTSTSIAVSLVAAPDRVTHYGYDVLGRLVSVKEDATPTNLSDDVNLTKTETTFDLSGRMDTQTTDFGGTASVTTDYDYDAIGRLDIQTDRDQSGDTLTSYDYAVRADGRRTGLTEEVWFNVDSDNDQDPGEVKSSTYHWTYDDAGRLTDEILNHWGDLFDQTESFTYDLTGNRVARNVDYVDTNKIDETTTYRYDANDRLIFEWLDNDVDIAIDQTTAYEYDRTQQIDQAVFAGFVDETTLPANMPQTVRGQDFTFNLQGRISSVMNDAHSGGVLQSRDRTHYEYDSKSYRVKLTTENDTVTGGVAQDNWTSDNSVEFLADHHNHTGYTQTIRETTFDSTGTTVTKTIDYTFGHDEIAQTKYDGEPTPANLDATHVFGHDGHGSVRVLYDLAAIVGTMVHQAATYAAYGKTLAVHTSNANLIGTTEAAFASRQGYSGEQWDASLRVQNLRARAYNPSNARFIGLDPFSGNMQDPQSLHKYAYVHGDPVNGIDPTGRSTLGNISVALSTGARIVGSVARLAFLGPKALTGLTILGVQLALIYRTLSFGVAGLNALVLVTNFRNAEGTLKHRATRAIDDLLAFYPWWIYTGGSVLPNSPNGVVRKFSGQINGQHLVPPTLLASVALAEMKNYNAFDTVFDGSDLGKTSIGIAQIRADTITRQARNNPPIFGPSGFIVDSVEFSGKETHRARQRTLPTDSGAVVTLVRGRCAA